MAYPEPPNVTRTPRYWAWLQQMNQWIDDPTTSMYGRWNAGDASQCPGPNGYGTPGEGGVDLPSPVGTPVYALSGGQVVGAGSFQNVVANIVTIQTDVPGAGSQYMYYQHIDKDPSITVGQQVQAGQQIGTVSSAGEVEVGFNAVWGNPWGPNTDCSKWPADPRPYIKALMLNQSTVPIAQGQGSNPNMPNQTSGGCAPWDIGCIMKQLASNNTLPRIGKVVLGGAFVLLALIGLIISLTHGDVGKAVKAGIKYAK